MNPFPAKFDGDCPQCLKKIRVGQSIKSRLSTPWVHQKCDLVLRPLEGLKLIEFRDAMKNAGFTNEPNTDFWHLDQVAAWSSTNEYFTVMFNVVYNYTGTDEVGGERSVSTYEVDTMLDLIDLLTRRYGTSATEDDFEAYRNKLLARMQP